MGRAFFGLLLDQDLVYTGIWLPTWRIRAIDTSPMERWPVDESGAPLP